MSTLGTVEGSRGYSLPEVLVSCLLGGLLLWLVLALLLAVQRAVVPRRVADAAGSVLAVAPCFEQAPAAMMLHGALRESLARCSAVYTFGGDSGGAAIGWAGATPLAMAGLPDLGALEAGLATDGGSFLAANGGAWGRREEGAGGEDFTLLLIGRRRGGGHGAICLVQVRSVLLGDLRGGDLRRREVRLWAEEGREFSYAFAERAGAGGSVGVVHSWYRRSPDGLSGEEGPAIVVFPDPWVFGGTRAGGGEPKGSRFSYLIPVFP